MVDPLGAFQWFAGPVLMGQVASNAVEFCLILQHKLNSGAYPQLLLEKATFRVASTSGVAQWPEYVTLFVGVVLILWDEDNFHRTFVSIL